MTESEQVEKLLAACKAYHEALDIAFAMLILATRPHTDTPQTPFFPSKSPMWPAAAAGWQVINEIEAARQTAP